VRNRKHVDSIIFNIEDDRVREVAQNTTVRAILSRLPPCWSIAQRVDDLKHFGAERVCSLWVALKVPGERSRNLCLRIRQNEDPVLSHRELMRERASTQGTGLMAPLRSPALRCSISTRQASEMLASSLPSRLSRRATTSAERSSVGSARASSRRWSTRAFMRQSIASSGSPTPNHSLNPRPATAGAVSRAGATSKIVAVPAYSTCLRGRG